MDDVQVLLFPAMKPEDQKAGALTSAAPPSAAKHPGPSSSKVQNFDTIVTVVAREHTQDQQHVLCSTASLLLLPLKLLICDSQQCKGCTTILTETVKEVTLSCDHSFCMVTCVP